MIVKYEGRKIDPRSTYRHQNKPSLMVTEPPYRVVSGGSGAKDAPRGMLSKSDGKIFTYNELNLKNG